MVARFTPCCTQAELQSVLTDRAGQCVDAQFESHLEECPTCRAQLERLAAGQEWWESARGLLSDDGFDWIGADGSEDSAEPGQSPAFAPSKNDSATSVSFAVQHPEQDRAAQRALVVTLLPPGLLELSTNPDQIGRIGGYEIIDFIGRGGMGVVLKAFDRALNRFVAIKVLAAELAHNASARRRFAREAQAAAAVVHDHVVPIYAVDASGQIPYLVMAYIPGRSLQERIDQTGPLEVREILRIGMQTAAGLAAAHAQGLVHRDIKPANILLENSVERVRITDFGLARAMDEASQTQSGVLAGTPQYMAPEQAAGESIDYRTDLFSLGSVMYAMCTGHSPFRAETTVAVLRRICDGSPRPVREVNPDVPGWLAGILDKLLSKRPGDRFASAEDVARLLAEHLAQIQQPIGSSLPHRRWTVPWLAAGAAAVTAIVATILLAWFTNDANQSDQPTDGQQAPLAQPSASAGNAQAAPRARSTAAARVVQSPNPRAEPREADLFQAELGAVYRELDRLEQSTHYDDGRGPHWDPLRDIDARLDALEREIGVP